MGSVTYLLEVYVMERHVYKFEFKYDRQVNGKKTEFTVPVIVHNECYADACTKVNEFVRKNFADRVTEESTIKYVGEFVHGVLKPFVEEVKEEECMLIGKSKKELVNLNKGLMIDVNVQKNEIKTLKQRCENNQQKIESLQKRVDGFKAKANYMCGLPIVRIPRGSGKINFDKEFGKWYCEQDVNMVKKICEAIEKQQPYTLDANSVYPQTVDVCKVYQIERDQALKENEELKERVECLKLRNKRLEVKEKYYDGEYRKLSDEKKTHEGVINWYKKEICRLNRIIDDMENRLEKEVVDVCKVYQIERDQALKENEALQERIDWISADSEKVYENLRFTDMENDRLLNEVSGYKKELSQLNLLMDDMENRLEKQVVARDGMLKQLREYKAEKKRMNKIIDALTEDK